MNEVIRHARQVALNILKPSERDLAHGLELHEAALVIESYGLGLRAPLDPQPFNAAIDAGASEMELQDLNEEMSMTRWALDEALGREYQELWQASGVSCTFQNAGEEGNDVLRMLKRLARHTLVTDAMPDFLMRAATPDDIVMAHRQGKRCTYLTCNGVPLTGAQLSIQDELRYLPIFAQLGARMMHLTYNRRNLIGDGCAEPANAGLSDFGRAAIREMNRCGIIIDLAHTGEQTCLDAAAASQQPVVISHSAAAALNQHCRTKSDQVIAAVVDGGGTIGITNVPAFLGGTGDLSALLDHIDYVAGKFGVDAVTIGTDRRHASILADQATRAIKPQPRRREHWESLWPENDPLFDPQWQQPAQTQSMVWTNWPLFTVGLVQRGYSDDAILKIIGGNILRVARKVWAASAYTTGSSLPQGNLS